MDQIWSWAITAVSITGVWVAGNRSKWGWAICFMGQFLYFSFAFAFEQWGFVGHAICFWYVHGRNFYKWSKYKSNVEIEVIQ